MGKTKAAKADPTKLSPEEFHALKIAAKGAEKTRDKLVEGTGQAVDVTLRISGAINVAGENTFDKNIKPQTEDLLAIALGSVGEPTKKKISEALTAAYAELDADDAAERPDVSADEFEAALELVNACTIQRQKSQNGAVTGSLKVEKVG